MVKVNLIRRAEIGRERRAKSRARIVEATRTIFARRPIASVTTEDVIREAGLSRGAFYSHFHSLDELRAVLAAELLTSVKELLGRNEIVVTDPVGAIAIGCAAFISEARRDPNWGALIASGAFPSAGGAARERLKASLTLARGEGRLVPFSIEVGFDLVLGVVLQAMRSASEARLSPADVLDIVGGILRALGVQAEHADLALRQIPEQAAPAQDARLAKTT